jgi:signal transduction histidine kinase
VANLLDNGIRHNVAGGWLSVSTDTLGDEVRLRVVNGGARIDPDEVAALAEPFRRLDRSVAGFGLGLSIVRSIVVAHHGSATLRAPEDGGLAVSVTLPARPQGGPQPRRAHVAGASRT